MFEPISGFTDPKCTGQTDRLFLHENPQFLSAKGTTKKAEALELFVYPNLVLIWGLEECEEGGSEGNNLFSTDLGFVL